MHSRQKKFKPAECVVFLDEIQAVFLP